MTLKLAEIQDQKPYLRFPKAQQAAAQISSGNKYSMAKHPVT